MTGQLSFDPNTANKFQCLAERDRTFNLALRAEASGKPEGMVDRAVQMACDAENLAFDGRA